MFYGCNVLLHVFCNFLLLPAPFCFTLCSQVGPSLLVLGDEARDNGLKVSLLERLHAIYNSSPSDFLSETYCATLLNNYRCHRALLSLPSYLFYNSSLVAMPQSDAQLHPMCSDFPLHFICSSLNDEVLEVKEGINNMEAEILLDEVVKYVSSWPVHEWGCPDLSSLCIMTATSDQVSSYLPSTSQFSVLDSIQKSILYNKQDTEKFLAIK